VYPRGTFIERPEYKWEEAKKMAFELREKLLNGGSFKCVIAGSILRKKPIVHDIDILVNRTDENYRTFALANINATKQSGYIPEKVAFGTYEEIPTQIWFCDEDKWAPHLLEVTGPSKFNLFLRKRAKSLGYHLCNLGLFLVKEDNKHFERTDNNTEGNIIWQVLGKRWIPPEMRY
jgi:DNA polymerase/3'-5' exonuclease PolX